MNKPKYEIGDRSDDEKPEVIGVCEHCGKSIPIPHPSEESYSSYSSGLITVYAVCENCEFFDNHDGFFDFYNEPGNY